jgi:hypothetical protein
MVKRIAFLIVLNLFFSCGTKPILETTPIPPNEMTKPIKINGLSFVAASKPYDKSELDVLKQTHANHLAIMPFGFMPTLKSTDLRYDHPRQWWGERTEGCCETIKQCKKEGFEIMLKPQIWIGGGEFTGYIEMSSEDDWKEFEKNYTQFILHFAKIAEENKVEIYCIGTELGRFVKQRPEFWKDLIAQVRKAYSGKLTYAENWDCFDEPIFWKDLDFVGVDAYFPLSEKKVPTDEEIRLGWQKHIAEMEKCHKAVGKPILFTECGYRSIDYAAHKPWDYDNQNAEINEELQQRLIKVMFELWDRDWMAGGYIWKWFPYHDKAGGPNDDQFSPQNKLAEKAIKEFYQNKI